MNTTQMNEYIYITTSGRGLTSLPHSGYVTESYSSTPSLPQGFVPPPPSMVNQLSIYLWLTGKDSLTKPT